jgi:DNA polymerase-3 subunit epsilon
MNEIILDTETTGLSTREDHRIIEIACIETKNLIPTKKIFYKLINPERKISEDALKVHGYTNEKLEKEPKFKEIANELVEFISGKKLIIHNAPFDIGFLNHEFKKINMELLDGKKNIIDTLELARSKYPGSSNSLDNLCKKFNIDLSKRTKHNALLDCELLRKVYINLIGEKEPSLIFQEDSNSENVFLDGKETIKKKDYSKIVIKPSNSEIENHKKFLKNELRKNYF